MNLQKYTKAAKIFAITGALLCSTSLVYAETVVHTTRHYRDSLNAAKNAADDESLAEINTKSKHNVADNKPKKTRRPAPYSWEDALDYAMMYPEDITPHTLGGYKDKYGNFSKWCCLDFLGDQGLCNRGDSFWGRPSHTFIRFTIQYGQVTNNITPFPVIIWAGDINRYEKDPYDRNPYNNVQEKREPRYLRIVFESGYEKEFPTDYKQTKWYYYKNFNIYDILFLPLSLFFPISVADRRKGYIFLTSEDVWDIYKHGNIANIYLDDGHGFGMGTGQLSFFYSGEKQEEHKRQLNYGIEHMVRLLNINPATLAYERQQNKIATEKEYRENEKNKLKEEVKRDMMRKELLEEVKKEAQEEIKLGR